MTENELHNDVPETPVSLKLPVYNMSGSATGEEIELDPRLFGLERNDHVLYLAVKAELTNRRQGTRATKTREFVSGGGKKPWKQKGRGTARSGSNRSPVWRHGGTMFGPKPTDFEMKLPIKVKRLARKVALSVKAQSGAIRLLSDVSLPEPRTRAMADMLTKFAISGGSVLLLVDGNQPVVVKSCRNIPKFEVRDGVNASTYDILKARQLLISRSALDSMVKGLVNEK